MDREVDRGVPCYLQRSGIERKDGGEREMERGKGIGIMRVIVGHM
jgi:hypothetical protein